MNVYKATHNPLFIEIKCYHMLQLPGLELGDGVN